MFVFTRKNTFREDLENPQRFYIGRVRDRSVIPQGVDSDETPESRQCLMINTVYNLGEQRQFFIPNTRTNAEPCNIHRLEVTNEQVLDLLKTTPPLLMKTL